jgi:hypothetical protein
MNTISVISAIAVVVSIGGIFPQIVTMFQARTSAGQSALGWCLGVMVNGLLGYVNLVGAQSAVLAAGNAVGLVLSATALGLVLRYRSADTAEEDSGLDTGAAVSALLGASPTSLVDLQTAELEALHGAVVNARATRESCGARVASGARQRSCAADRSGPREHPGTCASAMA